MDRPSSERKTEHVMSLVTTWTAWTKTLFLGLGLGQPNAGISVAECVLVMVDFSLARNFVWNELDTVSLFLAVIQCRKSQCTLQKFSNSIVTLQNMASIAY